MQLSVILPAHNPRPEFLRETLVALAAQTLPKSEWELLLVDNASAKPLAPNWDLAWHPRARHLREEELGLTPARLRGIREARGELLVFVDDDNVLAPDYLQQARDMAAEWPMLGAWGGRVEGRYETPPPEWAGPYLDILAIREFTQDRWSNRYDDGRAHPCGAGLIVRRNVADTYAEKVSGNALRRGLDRKGKLLISCGDIDMALTAIDVGLGIGQFQRLRLTHLIPSGRLTESYLLNLAESSAFSVVILHSFRAHPPARHAFIREAYELLQLFLLDTYGRKFGLARRRGRRNAGKLLRALPVV